jgi:alpha-glucosidase (family GH31 glycosyl hydrolase)
MKKLTVLFPIVFFLFNTLIAQEIGWQETAPGVWLLKVGQEQSITLLGSAGIAPNLPALKKLPDPAFPLDKDKIRAEVIDGKSYLRFPLERNEEIYGLGLNFKTHNQRGRILNLHVDHYGGIDNGRTHAPVPFYVSSRGYGVLIDVARYITVYAGTAIRVEADDPPELLDRNNDPGWKARPYSDAVEILVPADGVNVYLFGGPTMLKAVQRYNLYNGGGILPPKWGLGFTQRVPRLYSDKDILKEVAEFETHDFPLDFIGLEPGWHSMAYPCTFEWDKHRFPDPQGFLQSLQSVGIRINLWMNPYVSPVGTLYEKVKPFSGTHTVWNGIVPDFTLKEPRELFRDHFMEHHIGLGVSGYKIDEVDGYDKWIWPDVATFPSGTSAEEMRQVYGLLFQKMSSDWFREVNRRTYGLVRASNAGASNLPYVIYNDYYSHRDFITALINSSFIGVLWTPEVRSSGGSEEWLRRMQSVCFSPMAMLDAWSDGTKPWSFPEVEDQVREVAQLRMQLLPYLYSTFAQYHFEGIPPFRAMQLEEGLNLRSKAEEGDVDSSENPYGSYSIKEIKYQYMMGDFILVVPMFEGEESREVFLPPGKWYDFYTGELAGEEEVIEVTPGLEKIPLFVKDGAIIPMLKEARTRMPVQDEISSLEIRHYGNKAGSFQLYDDDGTTFDYEQGKFSWTELKVTREDKSLVPEMKVNNEAFFHYTREPEWVFMTDE